MTNTLTNHASNLQQIKFEIEKCYQLYQFLGLLVGSTPYYPPGVLGYPPNTRYWPLAPGHSNQACVQHYSNPARQGFCCVYAHAFHQLCCSTIGERRVRRHNKSLAWLGSSSAARMLDSNGRGQGANTLYWEGSPAPRADNRGWTLQVILGIGTIGNTSQSQILFVEGLMHDLLKY